MSTSPAGSAVFQREQHAGSERVRRYGRAIRIDGAQLKRELFGTPLRRTFAVGVSLHRFLDARRHWSTAAMRGMSDVPSDPLIKGRPRRHPVLSVPAGIRFSTHSSWSHDSPRSSLAPHAAALNHLA